MNKRQTKTYKTARAIISFFVQNETLWQGKVPVEESIGKIIAYRDTADTSHFEQINKSTKGQTADKKKVRKQMIALALDIISKIRPFAKSISNNVLLVGIDFSETELTQINDNICVNRCKSVMNYGREYLPLLVNYKLKESDLEALNAAIVLYGELTRKRDVTKSFRIAATERLAKAITLLRQELKILDDLVKSQMPEEFGDTYFNLR